MPTNLDKFLETAPADLIDDLKAARAEKAEIDNREGVIMQLLEMVLKNGGPRAEELVRLAADEGVAIGPLRDQIRQVLSSKLAANEFFSAPFAVHAELQARGNRSVTLDNVRTTLRRMSEAGDAIQPRKQQLLYADPSVVNNKVAMAAINAVLPVDDDESDE